MTNERHYLLEDVFYNIGSWKTIEHIIIIQSRTALLTAPITRNTIVSDQWQIAVCHTSLSKGKVNYTVNVFERFMFIWAPC